MKRSCILLAALLAALSLTACQSDESPLERSSEPESLPESSAAERSYTSIDSGPMLPQEVEPQDLPVEQPQFAALILDELESLETEAIIVKNDEVDFSGGSLFCEVDDELVEQIEEILSASWQQVAEEPQGYTQFVTVNPAEHSRWVINLVKLDEGGLCYLFAGGPGVGDPVYYQIEVSVFNRIREMVQRRTVMLDAPVDEFFEPIREVVDNYRSNSYIGEEYAAIFQKPPPGAVIPALNSVDSLTVIPGDMMTAYYVLFPIDNISQNMVLAMVEIYSAETDESAWRVLNVSFRPMGE